MSPQTVLTKLAQIAQKSGGNALRSGRAATVMTPCGLVNCKVFGSQGPLLTNRMTELVTYGSVGGGGSNPAPYPALDAAMSISLHIECHWRGASDVRRSPTTGLKLVGVGERCG